MQMVAHLRHMPQNIVEAKLRYIDKIRSRFMFATTLTTPPNAVNTILSEVCSLNKFTDQASQLGTY